jgi:stage II sporulation protein D
MRIVALVLVAIVLQASPAAGAELPVGDFSEVAIVPAEGTLLEHEGRVYNGTLRVGLAPDGLVLVEDVGLDGYLSGIKEVPLTWHSEALAAQAVAARTYLAWTLDQGRSENAVRYGYDICATTACQVYAGVGVVLGPDGDRWLAAIGETSNEILTYGGAAAKTMYHSTSGGRTEPVEDIFGGNPLPYLAGADSAGESSPYVDWSFEIPVEVFVTALRAADVSVGSVIEDIEVVPRPQGGGQWAVIVRSSEGVTELTVNQIRAIMNRYGAERFPGLLPAPRPDGVRYPQAVLSYRFDIEYTPPENPSITARLGALLPDDDLPSEGSIRFAGNGWGHHVGMSQYGALSLAEAGNEYPDILAHYYGGLRPTDGTGILPDEVTVGLSWGDEAVTLVAGGAIELVADGVRFPYDSGGSWVFTFNDNGRIAVVSPDRFLDGVLSRVSGLIPFL